MINTMKNFAPLIFSVIIFLNFTNPVFGQKIQHTSWLFWSHQQKLSDKLNLLSDIQLRSSDNMHYLSALLIRPGIEYQISKNQGVAVGYLYLGNRSREDGMRIYEPENRIWEQYQVEHDLATIEVTHRFRFEQRFLNEQDEKIFSQRLRYYIRGQIPLKRDTAFNKGLYAALQDEIFLNVQNKDQVSGSFFDQNRFYTGTGFRFSKSFELEAGYLFQFVKELDDDTRNNIVQLSINSEF